MRNLWLTKLQNGLRLWGQHSANQVCIVFWKFFLKALRNAPSLRKLSGLDHLYIRRSMTREERENDKEPRKLTHDLNVKEYNGKKVHVVHRNEVVKASEIPKIKPYMVQKTFKHAWFTGNAMPANQQQKSSKQ